MSRRDHGPTGRTTRPRWRRRTVPSCGAWSAMPPERSRPPYAIPEGAGPFAPGRLAHVDDAPAAKAATVDNAPLRGRIATAAAFAHTPTAFQLSTKELKKHHHAHQKARPDDKRRRDARVAIRDHLPELLTVSCARTHAHCNRGPSSSKCHLPMNNRPQEIGQGQLAVLVAVSQRDLESRGIVEPVLYKCSAQ